MPAFGSILPSDLYNAGKMKASGNCCDWRNSSVSGWDKCSAALGHFQATVRRALPTAAGLTAQFAAKTGGHSGSSSKKRKLCAEAGSSCDKKVLGLSEPGPVVFHDLVCQVELWNHG